MHDSLAPIVEQSPDVIVVHDGLSVLYVNRRGVKAFGVASADAVIGRTLWDFIPDTHHAILQERVAAMIEGGRPAPIEELPFLLADGTRAWGEIRSAPIEFKGERALLTVIRDVTDRHRAEEALRDSRERLDRAMAGSGLALWDWNVVTGEIYVDDRWYRMLGYEPGAFRLDLDRWNDMVHRDDLETVWAALQRHLDGETPFYECELRLRTRDSGWLWLLDRGQVVEREEDGTPIRAAGTHTIIQDRKEAEEAHRRSEERLATIIRAAPLGITLSRLADGTLIEVNDTFAESLGYDRTELLGRTSLELGLWVDPGERDAARAEIARAGRLRGHAARFRTRGGEVRTIQLFTELLQVDGERCILSLHQDITDSRRLEQQLRQAQKMEAIGRLAGGIAHDFNNLLTAITGHVRFLLDELPETDRRRDDALGIDESAQRAKRLTRQLLAFSRQQVLSPQTVDLGDVVASFKPLLVRLVGEDIELRLKQGRQRCTVRVDPGQLEQVVLNLVVNARDAMPDGGRVALETACVDADEGHPDLGRPVPPGRYACLRVSDSGDGMDEATRTRVFEPFFTTKPAGQGTGLGLSTVYGIVEQSDGFVGVESRPGDGSTFTVYFPLVDAPRPEPPAPPPTPPREERGQETLLVVEDEDAVRSLARRVLERVGYRVHTAANGASALAVLDSVGGVDLVLTDMVMPGMSGRELAERLMERTPDTRVVYMSGYLADERIPEEDHNGRFLAKPFTPDELSSIIRGALDDG